MARPPKDPALKMTTDLRIPVTPDQKQLVADAMALDGREFAGWARELILEAVRSMLDREKRKTARAGAKSDAGRQKSRG
jgi:hypothetical protein